MENPDRINQIYGRLKTVIANARLFMYMRHRPTMWCVSPWNSIFTTNQVAKQVKNSTSPRIQCNKTSIQHPWSPFTPKSLITVFPCWQPSPWKMFSWESTESNLKATIFFQSVGAKMNTQKALTTHHLHLPSALGGINIPTGRYIPLLGRKSEEWMVYGPTKYSPQPSRSTIYKMLQALFAKFRPQQQRVI